MIAAASSPTKPAHQDRVAWLLIAGLIFLRFPLLFLAAFVPTQVGWVLPACEIGTYLLVAMLIFWERERLAESHIDGLALGLLLLKPFELWFYRYGGNNAHSSPVYLLYIPIALLLAAALFLRRPRCERPTLKNLLWLIIGALIGMGMGITLGYIFNHFQGPAMGRVPLSELFTSPAEFQHYLGLLIANPVQQAFYAGGMEEPLFRGFLWGALRRAGWKDGWICLFQAGLFCFGHIYYLFGGQYGSFGFTFVAALIFGVLAWRSRSIATSMAAHGFANGWGDVLGHMILW